MGWLACLDTVRYLLKYSMYLLGYLLRIRGIVRHIVFAPVLLFFHNGYPAQAKLKREARETLTIAPC